MTMAGATTTAAGKEVTTLLSLSERLDATTAPALANAKGGAVERLRADWRTKPGNDATKIETRTEGDAIVVAPAGRLDAAGAPGVETGLRDAAMRARGRAVLDCRCITYIASAGLRAILIGAQACMQEDGELAVASPLPECRAIMEATGFLSVLNYHESVEAALAGTARLRPPAGRDSLEISERQEGSAVGVFEEPMRRYPELDPGVRCTLEPPAARGCLREPPDGSMKNDALVHNSPRTRTPDGDTAPSPDCAAWDGAGPSSARISVETPYYNGLIQKKITVPYGTSRGDARSGSRQERRRQRRIVRLPRAPGDEHAVGR